MVSSGYPNIFSPNNTKAEFIAKGLLSAGIDVMIVDEIFGSFGQKEKEMGISDAGVPFIVLPRNKRRLNYLPLNVVSIWHLLKERKQNDGNHIVMGMSYYPFYFIVVFMAMLLGYKRSALFHEWHIGFKDLPLWKKIEANVRDRTFGYFLNVVFPISHFLVEKSKHFHRPIAVLPILGDFSRVPMVCKMRYYFSYCCSVEYLLRCPLVLDAFAILVQTNPKVKLILVLSGYDWKRKEIDSLISEYSLSNNVIIRTKVPQEELYQIYECSIGLLIPLDPNSLQDKARFSQKIAEYVATKRPIITSAVGEIPYYFKNEESAIIADYTVGGYHKAMEKLLLNPELADKVGEGGYVVGASNFDYKVVGKQIAQIIKSI